MPLILVVDDEPMVLELVATILRTSGFSVLTANSGDGALSVAQRYRGEIKLLITDVTMPRMDGPTLARRLAEDEPSLAVLFISGTSDPSQFQLQERMGFLCKPFSPQELLAEVNALIAQPSVLAAG